MVWINESLNICQILCLQISWQSEKSNRYVNMIQNKMGETTLADNDYVLVLLSIEEEEDNP